MRRKWFRSPSKLLKSGILSAMQSNDLRRRIEENLPSSILILASDRFDRERAIETALAVIPGERCRFDAENVTLHRLRSELNGGSLFSDKRVVIVRSLEKARRELVDEIQKVLAFPFPGLTLLLAGEKGAAQGLSRRVGLLLDFPAEKPWAAEKERPEWARQEAKGLGKALALDAARLLVSRVGVDKESLFRELEKLTCFVGGRKEISRADVEELTLFSTPPAIWELARALFASDIGGSLSIARRLIGAAMPLPPLLSYLRGRIEEGIQICALLEEGGGAQVSLRLPHLTGARLEGAIEEARRFGMGRLRAALSALFETELRSRQQEGDDLLLLQRWIAKVIA
jgi:DNA polymerase III delta subunit